MSVIEDVRQVVQDFLAPELRAIAVQIESTNKRMDNLKANIALQFAAARTEASSRQEVVLSQIEHVRALLDVDKRLLRLESQRGDPLSKSA
jgi:translation elongation factor EF-Ts